MIMLTGSAPPEALPSAPLVPLDSPAMRVEYAFIAEAADVQAGLFYVTRGGTDIWHIPAEAPFPVGLGPMSFVVRAVGGIEEIGQEIPVQFTLVDADSRSIGVSGNGSISFNSHPIDRTRTGGALLHFRLGFAVPAPGAYFFQLESEGERLCQIPFWVVEVPPG